LQAPVLESEIQRNLQAKAIHGFVQDIMDLNPDAMVVVLGDLNDFPWSEPIKILAGDLLVDMITTLPIEERYTYIYEGNAQVLDHILVSDALLKRAVMVDPIHINSEFLAQQRLSDHDPMLVVFDMTTE